LTSALFELRQRGARGAWPPWIFAHDITNICTTQALVLRENISTRTNNHSSLLRWLTLSGRSNKANWEPNHLSILNKNVLKSKNPFTCKMSIDKQKKKIQDWVQLTQDRYSNSSSSSACSIYCNAYVAAFFNLAYVSEI